MTKRKSEALDLNAFRSKVINIDSDSLYLFGSQISEDSNEESEDKQDTAGKTQPGVAGNSNNNDDDDSNENDYCEYIKRDPVARQQFDYDKNICFVNDLPEIHVNTSLSVAPGEGYVPQYILRDPDWFTNIFASMDHDAKNSLYHNRETKIGQQDIIGRKLLNINTTPSDSPAFLFANVQYIETKQLQGNLNIAFRKGKKTVSSEGTTYKLDDPYRVLDNIKGTPSFFRKKKMEFIAKLENLGPFTVFFTLSCGDKRYSENFTSLLRRKGHSVEYDSNFDEVKVDGISLMEFMIKNDGQHEFIRKNIVNATRVFQYRVRMFIKNVVMAKFSAIPVSYYNYRVEFQLRGAAHIHGALWVDYKKFIELKPHFKGLEEALENMTNEKILSEDEESLITQFCNIIASVSLKDPATVDIVKEVNIHHCTRACRKYTNNCRFNYPKFPSAHTLIATPDRIMYSQPEIRKFMGEKTKLVLSKVKKILKDEDVMSKILEETKSLDMKERIIAVLERAEIYEDLGVSHQDRDELYKRYHDCLKLSFRGYQVVMERDIDEIYVNNYNSEWIRAWNANLDIQVCLDHYAVVTYIMEYMNKDESGTFEFIQKALKDSENEPLRKKLQIVKNVFQTHRQVSQCEAIYRILPSFHFSNSNISCLFVHNGFRQNRSRMLREISKEEAKNKANFVKIHDQPDKFFEEATGLEDRYDDRPQSLFEISLAQFAKRYTLGTAKKEQPDVAGNSTNVDDDNDDEFEENDRVEVENDIEIDEIFKDHIISFKNVNNAQISLPSSIEIKSKTMILRKPLCLRFPKFKQLSEPHEFFFSQLRLYHPHTKEDLGVWETDEEMCRQAFIENEDAIKYVRRRVMKYQEKVELSQEKAQAEYDAAVGDILDSTKEQDQTECRDEGVQEPDVFVAHDPALAPKIKSEECEATAGKYVKVQLSDLDDLLNKTRKMDCDQRMVVGIGVEFAQNVRKSRLNASEPPSPVLAVVQGGAGSGKSFVINTMTEWMERIFRQPGDNPNYPYILRCAYTGTAANIISGQTLHATLKLPFGNNYLPLSSKIKPELTNQFGNLKVLIIDEYSFLRSDILYQIDLRLQEIKVNNLPFGGVSVFLFGDINQLQPVAGRHIFDEPTHERYKLSHILYPLWKNFKKYFLTFNHRQGEDLLYSNILNRLRVADGRQGEISNEDLAVLKTRVFKQNHRDIPNEALELVATNIEVNSINNKRLKETPGELIKSDSIILSKTGSNIKPTINNCGEVKNTPLQAYLQLKIGVKVMLTYNVDTCDGLTNGARGQLIGCEIDGLDPDKRVKRLYVHFFDIKAGRERRKHVKLTPALKQIKENFPDKLPTPVDRLEFKYSPTQTRVSTENTAINFPLRLCFATTAHRMQGQTVMKPASLVLHLKNVFSGGQAYVMLSRVQTLNQLFLIDDVFPKKIYYNKEANEELQNMLKNSENCNKDIGDKCSLNLLSFNIRSLQKHFADIVLEKNIQNHDMILLQQTCLTGDQPPPGDFDIEQYNCHFNSSGAGGGLAVYYKSNFYHVADIKHKHYQLTKFSSTDFNVICVYRSREERKDKQIDFLKDLVKFLNNKKKTIITGDFNTNSETSVISQELKSWNYKQLITSPTHRDGNIIDHCYISDNIRVDSINIKQTPVYYTDHDKIQINFH